MMIKRTYSKRKAIVFEEEPEQLLTPPPSSSPLRDITASTQASSITRTIIPPKKLQKLTQLTLDLGQRTRKKCQQCGMTYTPSNPLDSAFHKKFHAKAIGGVDISRRFVEAVTSEDRVWSGGENGDIVAVIARNAVGWKRKVVQSVKDVVEDELGGVGIASEVLWGQVEGKDGKEHDRYKAFLYLRGLKCIGFCLVERIEEAFEVQAGTSATAESSSITTSENSQNAAIGISRIWTDNSARRSGIAVQLLDTAREKFLYGMNVDKHLVAFSQPTESGGRLARKWFGKENGWLVYHE